MAHAHIVNDNPKATEPGTWIKASRYDDGKMAEGRLLTRWDLDEVAPDHPVFLIDSTYHNAWLCSAPLSLRQINT